MVDIIIVIKEQVGAGKHPVWWMMYVCLCLSVSLSLGIHLAQDALVKSMPFWAPQIHPQPSWSRPCWLRDLGTWEAGCAWSCVTLNVPLGPRAYHKDPQRGRGRGQEAGVHGSQPGSRARFHVSTAWFICPAPSPLLTSCPRFLLVPSWDKFPE